jgi:2-isopropylmalate synthase
LGFDLNKQELDDLYHRFTAIADRKKGLRNEEIIALIHELVGETSKAAAND